MINSFIFGLLRHIYTAVIYAGLPFLSYYQNKRIKAGKEDPLRISERKGVSSIPCNKTKVLWIHGASVGESLSVLPIIDKLLKENSALNIVLTTGTLSSAKILEDRLPDRAYHQFTPLDFPNWIKNFLAHWQPSAVVWVESEFWPNSLFQIKQQNIPLILLNGRVSDRSFSRWKKLPFFIKGMLNLFDICLAQSQNDQQRLIALGAKHAVNHGNIKLGAPALPVSDQALEKFKQSITNRPLWLLSSSHDGEESIAGDIHKSLSPNHPNILSLIVPRHPDRGPNIAEHLRAHGFNVQLRSQAALPGPQTEIYIADTVGELGLFYRLGAIVVMGKSFIAPGGGQNPYEAAKLGNAIIMGPYMENFTEITHTMLAGGAALQVRNAEELGDEINSLLGDSKRLSEKKSKALKFSQTSESIIQDTVSIISDYI